MSIQEILESAGLPAQRGVYTGRDKPDAYYTFLRLLGTPAVNADDEEKERREMYRVTLFHKGDFEAQLDKTKEVLKAAGVYINSIDAESYETETGYWLVPITVEILKEERLNNDTGTERFILRRMHRDRRSRELRDT